MNISFLFLPNHFNSSAQKDIDFLKENIKIKVTIQFINIFQLPPALAGGICRNLILALAKKFAILAKAYKNNSNLSTQLKLEAIQVLKIGQAE